jgi:hypothetical protein
MQFINDDSSVTFDANAATVKFAGTLRLPNAKAYEGLSALLLDAATKVTAPVLCLDVRELLFLNSSGITTLSLFVINTRNKGKPRLKVLGAQGVAWQHKSLSNFKKLWADLELVLS